MKIIVDLMTKRDNLYIDTIRIEPELNMIDGYYKNKPIVSATALRKIIEDKRPTLKNVDYNLYSCNENYYINYDY